jgi:hypothetical protein
MKKFIYSLLAILLIFGATSCHDLEETNIDPNNPAVVSSASLMNGAQKKMMDYIFDNWFSGRQALVYSQYWAQRNYTEEDRYQIRESVNNNYFNALYTVAGNLQNIENLNTDPKTKVAMAIYGNNENQIAAAKILKVWLMQVMADTWGSIPYSEAFKLKEGVIYAKYDDLTSIYSTLISELNEAIAMINEDEPAFTTGDLIYSGDAAQWKKFGNSLKCKVALRLSKVDPNWKKHIQEAVASGVFTSNDDNAVFTYLTTDPDQSYFYRGFFVDARNDFSIAKPFTNLLKGVADNLNGKSHPWVGVADPRLPIYTTARGGAYNGIPYGLKSNQMTSAIRNAAPTFYSVSNHPVILEPNFKAPYLTYAEVCFILSEYQNFDQAKYEEGIRASIEYWDGLNVELLGKAPISATAIDAYVDAVNDNVNAETVATQKYIHLYMNGPEAWAEYRRTGYPKTLLFPGEISHVVDGENLLFEPISDTKGDLPARVKYPTNESTLNGDNFNAAVAKLQDGTNNYYTKMFWDIRTKANPHPANK